MENNRFKCGSCKREFRTEEGLVVHEESCKSTTKGFGKTFLFLAFLTLIIGFLYFNFLSPEVTGYSSLGSANIDNGEEKAFVPIDTDGDGLTDDEEKRIGTNPQLYDTDGDTLSDYQEVKVGKTNPLKKNTDGDRYDDNEDPSPLKKNSAIINGKITGFQINPNYLNIGLVLLGFGLVSDLELYSTEVDIEIINNGNDYTSYLEYDVVLSIGKEIIDSERVSLGKLNSGDQLTKHTSFSTTLGNIPQTLISLITEQTEPIVSIKNLNYEKF